ncbi:hypothetical protein BC941DRAFT_437543 [Chlamydoabsidia padenii]|nr:hypothetical protein BC941DRAFT_437543 [Chlamydoabsidia padenii]
MKRVVSHMLMPNLSIHLSIHFFVIVSIHRYIIYLCFTLFTYSIYSYINLHAN